MMKHTRCPLKTYTRHTYDDNFATKASPQPLYGCFTMPPLEPV
ncbi:hypothetical protein [Rubritalea tangerina]